MSEIRWEFYPLVAQHELARTWLTMQRNLQLAPATIDAYGRNLNDYLAFCSKHTLLSETLTHEALALYVQDLASRPNPRGAKIVSIGSGYGLSRSTMQQRLTTVRLYHDYLIEKQIRPDNPVGRGIYIAGKGVSTQHLLTTVYNCAQIKLTTPRDGGSLWERLLRIPTGDGHDQEQDSEVRRIGAG